MVICCNQNSESGSAEVPIHSLVVTVKMWCTAVFSLPAIQMLLQKYQLS
jgi:hypothetical protein